MESGELLRIMRTCAGADPEISLDDGALDTGFEELGYDSLALLEITGQIEREFRIRLADDAVRLEHTPRELLTMVNSGA